MMTYQSPTRQVSLEAVVKRIFAYRQITRLDQQLMMSALLEKNNLSEQEQHYINQVSDGLRRGLIKVVD